MRRRSRARSRPRSSDPAALRNETLTLRARVQAEFSADAMADDVLAAYGEALAKFRAAIKLNIAPKPFLKLLPLPITGHRGGSAVAGCDAMSMMNFDAPQDDAARNDGCRRASDSAREPAQLSPLAQLVAAQPIVPAYSPIVLAGIVRMLEFALVALVGIADLFRLRLPAYGTSSTGTTSATAFGVAGARDARVPGRRHLSGPGVPRSGEAVSGSTSRGRSSSSSLVGG